MILEESNHKKL